MPKSASMPSEAGLAPSDVVAIGAVLREIPADFPAAMLVAQHLAGQGSALTTILQRRSPLSVRWAEGGSTLVPGEILGAFLSKGERRREPGEATRDTLRPRRVVGRRKGDPERFEVAVGRTARAGVLGRRRAKVMGSLFENGRS